MNIALYGRAFVTDCSAQINELVTLLQNRAAKISVYQPFYDFLYKTYAIRINGVALFDEMPSPDTDCLMSIGGDGTFLRSLKQVRHSGIPVIGINGGRMGFLSEATFDTLPETIDAIARKNYTIEERTLLEVQSDALPAHCFAYALNEVGIQRRSPAMISIRVLLNDELLPTYWSDGLLVATPTGSTAYSMSVGGPIVVPQSKNFILSPIAPHNLNIRSLVIADDSIIILTVETREGNAFLTIDNRLMEIPSGARIVVRKAGFPFRVIRLHGSRFFDTLREKLWWGKDSRNPY